MKLLELALFVVAAYATFWAAYVVAFPSWAWLRGSRAIKHGRRDISEAPSIAVMIPAHNMTAHIGSCIASLRRCEYPAERIQIYVIADHCSDDTAEIVEACGAVVLARRVAPAGKSYSIAWCLDRLAAGGVDPDLYIVIDATVEVDADFISGIVAKCAEGEDIVVGYASVDPGKEQWFIRCMGLTLVHRRLQNESREKLRLSSLIEGRAMAYSRSYINRFGWQLALPERVVTGAHPTEDWRHGVRVASIGLRVAFAEDARVYTPLRGTLNAATQQSLRWERGRIGNAMTYGTKLLIQSIAERDRIKLFAALDSIQPPVVVLGGISLCVLLGACAAFGINAKAILVGSAAFIVTCYALVVIRRGARDGIGVSTVLWAPAYLLWRFVLFGVSLVRFDRLMGVLRGATPKDK